jgi:hypothetical protein
MPSIGVQYYFGKITGHHFLELVGLRKKMGSRGIDRNPVVKSGLRLELF